MKFEQFQYIRPDLNGWKEQFLRELADFENAETFADQVTAMNEMNALRNNVATMSALSSIRHSIDTNDEFYSAEKDYFDEVDPEVEEMISKYYQALCSATFKPQLEEKFGRQLFALAEAQLKTFSPEIIPLLQQENKLASEYEKLVASAKISFDGEERNLAQLQPYIESSDRSVRKAATDAKYGFFATNLEQFDAIYDKLVKVRTEIAQKLGYQNFVELGYYRMSRTDYNPAMVANFRKQVREQIVPLATKLSEKQAARIGIDKLHLYDEDFHFLSGNANPKGSPEWIIENGQKMYHEMSKETDDFFHFMVENELMDLVAKKGKVAGGYCSFISDYQAPFIFSNFNGTSGDIDVLTHEVGHAFQCYESRQFEVPEYQWPTLEACEIHSMSMEFFAWPWMKLFFQEDVDKYYFNHLTSALQFLPYGVMVDEFQHIVYENPDLTPEDRRATWLNLEKIYLPHRNYDDNEYLNSGGFWQKQGHIYEAPFYYIDYTLAQICAFQFWKKMHEDHDAAGQDYLHLCKQGGSKSFVTLVEEAGLTSPFSDGCIASIVGMLEQWITEFDDQKL